MSLLPAILLVLLVCIVIGTAIGRWDAMLGVVLIVILLIALWMVGGIKL